MHQFGPRAVALLELKARAEETMPAVNWMKNMTNAAPCLASACMYG